MKPATPLPWRLAGDHESIELLGADGDCINSAARDSYGDDYNRVATDMNYERHAANAYPRLVEMTRLLMQSAPKVDREFASSLLNELGETS